MRERWESAGVLWWSEANRTLGLIVSVEGFKYAKRGREIERRGRGVRSEIETLARHIGSGDVIGVETEARDCGLRVMVLINSLWWEFLRWQRKSQPVVHGSHKTETTGLKDCCFYGSLISKERWGISSCMKVVLEAEVKWQKPWSGKEEKKEEERSKNLKRNHLFQSKRWRLI